MISEQQLLSVKLKLRWKVKIFLIKVKFQILNKNNILLKLQDPNPVPHNNNLYTSPHSKW